VPAFLGRRVFKNFDLAELAKYIDWGPFFQTWDLAGPFPAILKDEVVGAEASACSADGKAHAAAPDRRPLAQANGVMGCYPANTVDDDIELYTDESRSQVAMTWYGLRQQTEKQAIDGVMRPSRCLADFIAPQGRGARLHRHVRRDGGHWRREEGASSSWTTTTTTRPSCSRPGRPAGRGLCRAPAPARAHRPVGLCAATSAEPRDS
jgi:hypothetical protein